MGFTIFHILYSHQESITTGSYFQRVGGVIGSKSFCPPSLFLLHSFSLFEIYDRFGSVFQTGKLTAKTLHVYVFFFFFFTKSTLGKICTGNQSRKLSPVITKPRDKSHINSLYLSQHLSLFLSHFIPLYAFCSDRVLKACTGKSLKSPFC